VTANRRQFLQAAAALAVATRVRAADRASIGVQFFSFNRVAGEGWEQFSAAMQTAREIGYDGVASVEIFRPEYWERDAFQLARDAKAATEQIVNS